MSQQQRIGGVQEAAAHIFSAARELEVANTLVDHVLALASRDAPAFDEASALSALIASGLSEREIIAIRERTQVVQLTNNIRDFALAPHKRLPSPTRDFVAQVGLAAPGESVLDVGCSAGRYLLEFASPDARLTGLDIDAFSMTVAHVAWSRTQVTPPPTFVTGSADSLPFTDASFDLVTSFVVLGCVPLRATMMEIARVLAPGGRFFATVEGPGFLVELWQRRPPGWRAAARLTRWWLAHACSLVGIDHQRLPGGSRLAGVSIYSRSHMQRALESAGMELLSYEALAHRGRHDRLIGLVARKPSTPLTR